MPQDYHYDASLLWGLYRPAVAASERMKALVVIPESCTERDMSTVWYIQRKYLQRICRNFEGAQNSYTVSTLVSTCVLEFGRGW